MPSPMLLTIVAITSILLTLLLTIIFNIGEVKKEYKGDLVFDDETFYLAISQEDLDDLRYGHDKYVVLKVVRKKN